MRPILALAILCLSLTGCGQPLTRADFEAAHPWSPNPLVLNDPAAANDRVTTLAYPDAIPRLDPVTGAYHREHGMHVLRVQAGVVIERTWHQDSYLLP